MRPPNRSIEVPPYANGDASTSVASMGRPAPALPPDVRLALERIVEQIDYELPDVANRVIVVIGSQPGDGASTVAWWLLALLAAIREGDMLYLDGATLAGPAASAEPGAAGSDTVGIAARARASAVPRVFALTGPMAHTGKQPSRNELAAAVAELRARFAYVVIDAAPPALSPLSLVIAQQADGVLLVLEANGTDREHAQDTVDLIRRSGGRLLGAVLNKSRA
jgi:succinoglycan biosynthesis transport protein ExoP